MFESARLKITAWYILIVMAISILFSLAIYQLVNRELETGFRRVAQRYVIDTQSGFIVPRPTVLEAGYIESAEKRVELTLFYINIAIFGFSAAASYFLAGKTLKPIKAMVEEQKRFITDASHELRTPLTAARTTIEVGLRDKELKLPQAKELLTSTLEEIDNMQLLSNNLLRLAQFQNQKNNQTVEALSLQKIIQKSIQKVSAVAKSKEIKILTNETDATIEGNQENLTELFVIFLDNAIKYSPEKTNITISLSKKDHLALIDITDQGVGIEKKDLPHIFNRFYRTDKSRSKNTVAGYGLGLSIAKQITDEYKGNITVKSNPDQGTTFTIKLPTK